MATLNDYSNTTTINKETFDALVKGFTLSALANYLEAQRKDTIKSIVELEVKKAKGYKTVKVMKKGKRTKETRPLDKGDLNMIAEELDEEWQYAEKTFGAGMVEFERELDIEMRQAFKKNNLEY